MITYWAEHAWLGERTADRVTIDTDADRIARIRTDSDPPPGAVRLPGLTVPGLANAHSHAYDRAIRGRAESGAADFWAWREVMYAVAAVLEPGSYYRLARAVYAEMALAGITMVGEFHYVHRDPAGRRYADPNAMGHALMAAAADAGIRITLFDTCYLQGGPGGQPVTGVQVRFSDGDVDAWANRTALLRPAANARIGAAIHSVRAVPAHAMRVVAQAADQRDLPLHVHLSEQPAENEACQAATGMSPAELLDHTGVLSPRLTAVHATHVSDTDIRLLGTSGTTICLCPTTERDLGDGVGPAARLSGAGCPLAVGSDAHMVVDLWEEMRAIELNQRLLAGRRGLMQMPGLIGAGTVSGARALGWDAGRIAEGALADLATVDLGSPRTAGHRSGDLTAHALFTATAADVTHVVVGGRLIVADRRHQFIPDVGHAVGEAVTTVLGTREKEPHR
jgi:formiminoglutamate deiminase